MRQPEAVNVGRVCRGSSWPPEGGSSAPQETYNRPRSRRRPDLDYEEDDEDEKLAYRIWARFITRNLEPTKPGIRLYTISTGQRGSACMNALPYDLFRILLSRITTIP
jgi:hypothetical protein